MRSTFSIVLLIIATSFAACKGCDDSSLGRVECVPGNPVCECNPGETKTCGSAVGACGRGQGRVQCVDGHFPDCAPTILPQVEDCSGEDKNCNGVANDVPGLGKECWNGHANIMFQQDNPASTCRKGILACVPGKNEPVCDGEIREQSGPFTNCQNGNCCLSRACTGQPDQIMTSSTSTLAVPGTPCKVKVNGVCYHDTYTCVGVERVCGTPETRMRPTDACGNFIDDCYGPPALVTRQCDSHPGLDDNGPCQPGEQTCGANGWGPCMGSVGPQSIAECGRVDYNCDGRLDRSECECQDSDPPQPCNDRIRYIPTSTGGYRRIMKDCGWGQRFCENGKLGNCIGDGNGAEERCNGYQDICSGPNDASLTKRCGAIVANPQLSPPCHAGVEHCIVTGQGAHWGNCEGAVNPGIATCSPDSPDCGIGPPPMRRYQRVKIAIAIDTSGSMGDKINELVTALVGWITPYIGTEHLFGIGTFGDFTTYPNNHSPPISWVIPGMSGMSHFLPAEQAITALHLVRVNGGDNEPSIDVALWLSNPQYEAVVWENDPPGRPHHPIAMVVTDELPQTRADWGATHLRPYMDQIAMWTAHCQLQACLVEVCHPPNCQPGDPQPGDPMDFFVATNYTLDYGFNILSWPLWQDVVGNNQDHFIELGPPLDTSKLPFLFQSVCRP